MINATLFVQIINFGIACFIIDRLLLRFAVQVVKQDKKKEEYQRERVDTLQSHITAISQEKEQSWRLFKNQLQAKIPKLQRRMPTTAQDKFVPQDISEAEVELYKKKVVAQIIESVSNVH